MNSAVALLRDLDQHGVVLWVQNGELHYRSPPGELTREHLETIAAGRAELMEVLRWRTYLGRRPYVEGAERVWPPTEAQLSLIQYAEVPYIAAAGYWRGQVDEDVFRSTLARMLERHAVLRTRFVRSRSGALWAATQRKMPVPVQVADLRGIAEPERSATALKVAAAILEGDFQIQTGPLLRVGLLILDAEEAWFVFAVHHSLFDAPSRRILVSEFLRVYAAALEGVEAPLDPLPMEFADFACQQYALLEGPQGDRTAQYWSDALSGAHSLFWLPYERRPGPESPTGTPPDIDGVVSQEVVAALHACGREYGATLFFVVITAFLVVLCRWSRRGDVASWICHVGRGQPELQGLIGCFANFWPLRVDLSGNPSFAEALRRVQRSYVAALPHAHVTDYQLGPELRRITAGNLLPGIYVNYMPLDKEYAALGMMRVAATTAPIPGPQRAGLNDGMALYVEMGEYADGFYWRLRHSGRWFEHQTIERVSQSLAAVLTTVPAQAEKTRLSGLLPEEIAVGCPLPL